MQDEAQQVLQFLTSPVGHSLLNLLHKPLYDKIETLEKTNEELSRKLQIIEDTMKELTEKGAEQEKKTNPVVQQNKENGIRRHNIVLSGINTGTEDPIKCIQEFLTSEFNIQPAGILAVQKLQGKYLVTMKSCWDARQIYSQRLQKLRGKNIYIAEDLTVAESCLFYRTRQLKKHNIIHSTWTQDGHIFIRKSMYGEAEEVDENHYLVQNVDSARTQAPPSTEKPHEASKTPTDTPITPSCSTVTASEEIEDDDEPLSQECLKLIEGAITRASRKKKEKTRTGAKEIENDKSANNDKNSK